MSQEEENVPGGQWARGHGHRDRSDREWPPPGQGKPCADEISAPAAALCPEASPVAFIFAGNSEVSVFIKYYLCVQYLKELKKAWDPFSARLPVQLIWPRIYLVTTQNVLTIPRFKLLLVPNYTVNREKLLAKCTHLCQWLVKCIAGPLLFIICIHFLNRSPKTRFPIHGLVISPIIKITIY